ncbi:restriction endonuclease subunit S [Secundilactobacillus kimchicus]|nr:restriction endonuclease subunit S [Secundilactobacillus kimchicus]
MRDAQISDSSTDEYLKTYNIIHLGEMIFEGHSSKEYKSGRFVVNDYRPGIVSHVFDVFQFKKKVDISFSKRYFHSERVMGKILQRSTSSARMLNALDLPQFLKQNIHLPALQEQKKIGDLFNGIDTLIASNQRKQLPRKIHLEEPP